MSLADFAAIRPCRLPYRYVQYRTSFAGNEVPPFRHWNSIIQGKKLRTPLPLGVGNTQRCTRILQWMDLYEGTSAIYRMIVSFIEQEVEKRWLNREAKLQDRSHARKCSIIYECSWLLLMALACFLIRKLIDHVQKIGKGCAFRM